ncbi:uncharacterized protein LOC124249940 [Equus quagga]|uniref:uncharacterized protein LOC124249940 n=1 Tax=Equus quagga TaxID=89248 RepID=UPI001EE1B437|nr:uncharacterized protein LOC124249940 [Equus quagga]
MLRRQSQKRQDPAVAQAAPASGSVGERALGWAEGTSPLRLASWEAPQRHGQWKRVSSEDALLQETFCWARSFQVLGLSLRPELPGVRDSRRGGCSAHGRRLSRIPGRYCSSQQHILPTKADTTEIDRQLTTHVPHSPRLPHLSPGSRQGWRQAEDVGRLPKILGGDKVPEQISFSSPPPPTPSPSLATQGLTAPTEITAKAVPAWPQPEGLSKHSSDCPSSAQGSRPRPHGGYKCPPKVTPACSPASLASNPTTHTCPFSQSLNTPPFSHPRAFAHASPLPGSLLTYLHLLNPSFLGEACPDCPLPHSMSQTLRARPSCPLTTPPSTVLSHLHNDLGESASPQDWELLKVWPGPRCVPSPTQHRPGPEPSLIQGGGG